VLQSRTLFFCTNLSTPRNHTTLYPEQGLVRDFVRRGWESILELTPCDLWHFMGGRTLWLAGDSQMQSLRDAFNCFLIEFDEVLKHVVSSTYWHLFKIQPMP
jgi:hypothetical protein